jgi:hypothetical protein
MAESLDIMDEATNALTMITIMRNETLTKKPDHEFVEYFNKIEVAIRKMRERNLKMLGEMRSLEYSISKLGSIEDDFEEHLESLETKPNEPFNEAEYMTKTLISKQFNEPPF